MLLCHGSPHTLGYADVFGTAPAELRKKKGCPQSTRNERFFRNPVTPVPIRPGMKLRFQYCQCNCDPLAETPTDPVAGAVSSARTAAPQGKTMHSPKLTIIVFAVLACLGCGTRRPKRLPSHRRPLPRPWLQQPMPARLQLSPRRSNYGSTGSGLRTHSNERCSSCATCKRPPHSSHWPWRGGTTTTTAL